MFGFLKTKTKATDELIEIPNDMVKHFKETESVDGLWQKSIEISLFIDSVNKMSSNTLNTDLKDYLHSVVVSKRKELDDVLTKIKQLK